MIFNNGWLPGGNSLAEESPDVSNQSGKDVHFPQNDVERIDEFSQDLDLNFFETVGKLMDLGDLVWYYVRSGYTVKAVKGEEEVEIDLGGDVE